MMWDYPDVVAKAIFECHGENGELQAPIIAHADQLWVVLTWFGSLASGMQYPERIIPLERLAAAYIPHGGYRLGLILPKELFSSQCPPELLKQFGAQVHPAGIAHIPGPSSIQ